MIEFRGPIDSDREAIAALMDAVEAADGLPALTEFKAVQLTGGLGHTVIGVAGDRVRSLAQAAWHHGDERTPGQWALEVAVEPVARSTRLWADTVAAGVAALRDGAPHVVWSWLPELRDVLDVLGYHEVRRLAVMERALPTGEEPAIPDGVELAPFVMGRDEQAWLRVNNAAFAGHPENGGVTEDDLASRMALEWFRPEDLLMAWSANEAIGFCWTKRHRGGVGEIYIIGVHPDEHGRGLGRALVLGGLEHLASDTGARTGMLYVDESNGAAMQLYRSLGFRTVRVNTMHTPGEMAQPKG